VVIGAPANARRKRLATVRVRDGTFDRGRTAVVHSAGGTNNGRTSTPSRGVG